MRVVLLGLGLAAQLREALTASDSRLSDLTSVDDLGQWLSSSERPLITSLTNDAESVGGSSVEVAVVEQKSFLAPATELYLRCASMIVLVPAAYYVFRSAPSGKQEEKLIEADETAQEQAGAGENNATQQTISVYFRRAFNGLLWLASTLSMNLSNKEAVQSTPTLLALLQMVFTVLVLVLIWPVLGMDSFGQLRELTPWLPVCFLFAAMLVTALIGFALAPISVIIIMASLRPLIALTIETNLFGDSATNYRIAGAVLGAVGAVVYLVGNMPAADVSTTALVVLGFNSLVATVDRCYQRYYLHHKPVKATKAALVLTFNVGGALLVLAAYPLWKHEVPFFQERWAGWEAGRDIGDLYIVLLSCLSGLALGYFGVAFQTDISATGFMVSQAGARTLLLIIDHFWKGTALTPWGGVGVLLVISSSFVSLME